MSDLIRYEGTPAEGLILPNAVTSAAKAASHGIGRISQMLPDPSPEKTKAFCYAALNSLNRITKDCEPASIGASLANAAALGLMPDTSEGLCHLIPRAKRRGATPELTFCMGYRGFLRLAYGSGFLKTLHADVVLKDEPFKFWADDDGAHIEHDATSRLDRPATDDRVRGSYMSFVTKDGGRGAFLVGGEVLRGLRQSAYGDVWQKNFIAMSRKTPIVRGGKLWDTSADPRLMRAIRLDEEAERGEYQSAPEGFDPRDVMEVRPRRRIAEIPADEEVDLTAPPEPDEPESDDLPDEEPEPPTYAEPAQEDIQW